MNNVENNLLLFKKRKFKLFKVFDLFIRTTLTMVGTLSLVSILMFLNNYFGVSYFSCFLMALVMPNLYSNIINVSLKELDNKIKEIQNDIYNLAMEIDKCDELSKDDIIKNIEIRFEGLSSSRKKELLNYIKSKMVQNNDYRYISKLENDEVLVLLDSSDKTSDEMFKYSRKRNISDEIKR